MRRRLVTGLLFVATAFSVQATEPDVIEEAKVETREMATSKFSTTLPGAPDGEYVVFQFNSSFEHKATALETVTAMKDIDGAWRVAGYFIR